MSRIMSVPTAAPSVAAATAPTVATATAPTVAPATATAAFTTAAASTAAASAAALGKRHICSAKRSAKRKPECAETCGKSQDDEFSVDRPHDIPLARRCAFWPPAQCQRDFGKRVPPPPRL
jgi:hypothetical protein